MTTIYYDDRPCGSGKTYTEVETIVSTRGLYLYAVEKREAMAERVKMIEELAAKAGTRPTILTIFSAGKVPEVMADGSLGRPGSQNVRADIEGIAATYLDGHVIVMVTHEGLKMGDLTGFCGGWNLVIDETISIWDRQTLTTTVTADFLRQHYDLVQIEGSQSRSLIRARQRRTAKSFSSDDMARAVGVLHSRILSDRIEVATDLMSWDELDANPTWSWWSIWSPEQLAYFDRVVILANAFTRSVTFRILSTRWPEIGWQRLDRVSSLEYARRRVVIHHFARAHTAIRALFATDRGQRHLRLIGREIDRRIVDPSRHIWTCNTDELGLFLPAGSEALLPGTRLTPRQQGSNRYAACTSATMIYTSKPDGPDRVVMREMGLNSHVIVETREYEVMVQFACRTSIRVANSTDTVNLYVYDAAQARHLEAYFNSTGYCEAETVLIDLGFADYERDTQSGRPKNVLTEDEVIAKADRDREKDRLRQQRRRAKLAAAKATAAAPKDDA